MPYAGLNLIKTAGRFVRAALSPDCWYLIYSVTNRCNQRCVMCFNWRSADRHEELTIDEIYKIASRFNNLFQLTLSGGEPLLRPDLPDIIKAFNQNRTIPRITLPSNGQLPSRLEKLTAQVCRENQDSNINLALSLDGINERHDRIRGVEGAFAAFEESRQRLVRLQKSHPNLSLVVATVVSSFNQDHVPELLKYISKSTNPAAHGLMLARGDTRRSEARNVNEKQFLDALVRLRDIQRPTGTRLGNAWSDAYLRNRLKTHQLQKMHDPCRAGKKLLILNHKGDLSPCEVFEPLVRSGEINYSGPTDFGNVRDFDYRLKTMLQTESAGRLKDFIAAGGCWCTFECALLSNFALNLRNYPQVLGRLLFQGRRPVRDGS